LIVDAIYAGLGLVSVLIQVLVTPRFLTRRGVGDALTVLPVIVVASTLGFAVTGAAVAIVLFKLGDGGLRHSLHRVASEILRVPREPREPHPHRSEIRRGHVGNHRHVRRALAQRAERRDARAPDQAGKREAGIGIHGTAF